MKKLMVFFGIFIFQRFRSRSSNHIWIYYDQIFKRTFSTVCREWVNASHRFSAYVATTSKYVRNESRYTLQFPARLLVFLSAAMRHPSRKCDKGHLISVICSSRSYDELLHMIAIVVERSRIRRILLWIRRCKKNKNDKDLIKLYGYLIRFSIEFVCFWPKTTYIIVSISNLL